jgi:hypothetical protein
MQMHEEVQVQGRAGRSGPQSGIIDEVLANDGHAGAASAAAREGDHLRHDRYEVGRRCGIRVSGADAATDNTKRKQSQSQSQSQTEIEIQEQKDHAHDGLSCVECERTMMGLDCTKLRTSYSCPV